MGEGLRVGAPIRRGLKLGLRLGLGLGLGLGSGFGLGLINVRARPDLDRAPVPEP